MALATFNKASIGGKLAISNFTITSLAFILAIFAIGFLVINLVNNNVSSQLGEQVSLLSEFIKATDSDIRNRSLLLSKTFFKNFDGSIELSDLSINIGGRSTQKLLINEVSANLNFELVDSFTQITGAVATIFVKSDNDFIRVTTSLKNEKNERAIGTILDHNHPGYKILLDGKDFTGIATLFGRQYMTHYEPIRNANGKVIGISFIGLDFTDQLLALKNTIRGLKIGKTGYFYALDTRDGDKKGNLVIHPAIEGKNILHSVDENGHAFVEQMLKNKNGEIRYQWINKELGELEPRNKIVSFVSFPEWNWIIAGGSYIDEFTQGFWTLMYQFIIACLLLVLLMSLIWMLVIKKIVINPIQMVSNAVGKISEGDLTSLLETNKKDEIGHLVKMMVTMKSVLVQFQEAQILMGKQHSLGMIEHRMPTNNLPGVYGEMARSINNIVQSHISIKSKVIDVVTAYTNGNFEVIMDRLPGKAAYVSEAIDQVQNAMRLAAESAAFNEQIRSSLDTVCVTVSNAQKLLVHATTPAKKILKLFGGENFDTEKYYGNKISSLFADPDHAAKFDSAVITGQNVDMVVNGHHLRLLPQLMVDKHGKTIGRITHWIDRTDEIITENELEQVVKEATEGQFTSRLNTDNKTGSFKVISHGLNKLMETCEHGLEDVSNVLQSVAQGDLTKRITKDYYGLFGKVKNSVNSSTENLAKVIAEVTDAACTLASAANQVSSTATSLSQSSCEQTVSVEEITAQIFNITDLIVKNSLNAKITNEMAKTSTKEAVDGGSAVAESVNVVKQILSKISIIDDISFKSNLLALNAAIEAAHAGSHGKGFAIVADEVRKLANSSQIAANEISELVAKSISITDHASNMINLIIPSITKTSTLVCGIDETSELQSKSVTDIGNSVTKLSKASEQNASASEELAATSQELSSNAMQLKKSIGYFNIG